MRFGSSGESAGSSCLCSFFTGSILHGRLLASALRAHHLHGDGKWCPKHMTSPCGYAKEHAGAGSFGGLMSLVGIRNPADRMPVSGWASRPSERVH